MVGDFYRTLGGILELLSISDYHKKYRATAYIESQIIPAVSKKQYRIYWSKDSCPIAFVSWAWVSLKTWETLSNSTKGLNIDEWNNGEILYFNDFISPYGDAKKVVKDLKKNVFPGSCSARSLRRLGGGKISKVNVWKNLKVARSPTE